MHDLKPDAVFHGDLKGVNVLISDDGRPLLADFGLSYLTNSSFSVPIAESFGCTISWTAPEMFEVSKPTAKTDVWSFGMTALELFTRKTPFHRFRGRAAMTRILKGPPDRPTDDDTCFRLTEEWWRLLSSCWNSEPRLRPTMPYIIEIIDRINNFAGGRARTIADVDATLGQQFQNLNVHNGLPAPVVPQSNFPVKFDDQKTINTVTIFTSNLNPLLTSTEVVITLLPDDLSRMFERYRPIVWRTLSFPANEKMQYAIEIPDAVGISTIRDKGDGVFVCVNKTTVTQQHAFTFTSNQVWERRLDMNMPPNVTRMRNDCRKPDIFAACAISARHGTEPILHLGTLTNGNVTSFEWPFILQAYVSNQCKKGQVLTSDIGRTRVRVDMRTVRNGMVQLYTENNQPTLRQVR